MVSLFVVLFFFKSRIEVLTLFFFLDLFFACGLLYLGVVFLIFDLFIRFFFSHVSYYWTLGFLLHLNERVSHKKSGYNLLFLHVIILATCCQPTTEAAWK